MTALRFELTASDASASRVDVVQVNVMENPEGGIFVSADAGDDTTGDGTRERPFASIARAIAGIDAPDQDVYVMSREN